MSTTRAVFEQIKRTIWDRTIWEAFPMMMLGAFIASSIGVICDDEPTATIEVEYEDGSGVLSDGRQFCIDGELCEAR
jgi:hypothetical protein